MPDPMPSNPLSLALRSATSESMREAFGNGRAILVRDGDAIERRVRITPKRIVDEHMNKYFRDDGYSADAWFPGMRPWRVASYIEDGGEWVELVPKRLSTLLPESGQ